MISGKNLQSQLVETSWTKEEYEELLNEDIQETEYIHKDIVFEPMHTYKNYEHATPYVTSSTLVKFPGKGTLCMFGGVHMTSRKATNEVWLYDIGKKLWERIWFNRKRERIVRLEKRVQYSSEKANKIMNLTPSLRCVEPVPRCGHCSVALSSKDMLIFGGHDLKNRRLLNDSWILRVDNVKTWKLVVPEGRVPIPRWYASAIKYRDRVYVFGGETEQFKLLNDISVFNILDERWLDVRTIYPTPSPRMLHSTVVINGKMYVIGGLGKKDDFETCDIWEFDLTILKWREVIPRSKISPFRCYEDDGTDFVPHSVEIFREDEEFDIHLDSEFGSSFPTEFKEEVEDISDKEVDTDFKSRERKKSEEKEEDGKKNIGEEEEKEQEQHHDLEEEVEEEKDGIEGKYDGLTSSIIKQREKEIKNKNEIKKSREERKQKKKLKKIWKPIYGHCSVAWGNRIIVYGGKRNHKLLDEVWMFNLLTEKWSRYYPPTVDTPPNFVLPIVEHTNVPSKRWKMMNATDITIGQIFEVADTVPKFGRTTAGQGRKKGSGVGRASRGKKKGGGKKRRTGLKGGKQKRLLVSSSKASLLSSKRRRDEDFRDPILEELEKLEEFGKEHSIMPFLSDKIMTQRKADFFIYGGNLDPKDCGETISDLWKMTLTIKQKRHY